MIQGMSDDPVIWNYGRDFVKSLLDVAKELESEGG